MPVFQIVLYRVTAKSLTCQVAQILQALRSPKVIRACFRISKRNVPRTYIFSTHYQQQSQIAYQDKIVLPSLTSSLEGTSSSTSKSAFPVPSIQDLTVTLKQVSSPFLTHTNPAIQFIKEGITDSVLTFHGERDWYEDPPMVR